MMDDELTSTVDEILQSCPKFRILLLGRSGVGKSALINAVFGVGHAVEEHSFKAGVSDIEKEIESSENPRLILHDSQGFSYDDPSNFSMVQRFILDRSERSELKDRLHAIWLCIEIPTYGGSLLERVEEKVLAMKDLKVPIIVVLTKYDRLVTKIEVEMDDDEDDDAFEEKLREEASKCFEELCLTPLRQVTNAPCIKVSDRKEYQEYLDNLVHVTHQNIDEVVWLLWAIAQRQSAGTNLQASIDVGKRNYWKGLSTALELPGNKLAKWLNVVHRDIVKVWGFHDPNELLQSKLFRKQMSELQEDLVNNSVSKSAFPISVGTITGVATIVSGIVPPAAPIAIPIAAGLVFAGWVYGVVRATPNILRGMMGYIVDLTIVMQSLFWLSEAHRVGSKAKDAPTPPLGKRLVKLAYSAYLEGPESDKVHNTIREFVTRTVALKPETVLAKIVDLIETHRFQPKESYKKKATEEAPLGDDGVNWDA